MATNSPKIMAIGKSPVVAVVPTSVPQASLQSPPPFPIVGVGASVGGLGALQALFAALPEVGYPDMAFVLVQHQPSDQNSRLRELIQRRTHLPVFDINDGVVVKPRCIYCLPSGCRLVLGRGGLMMERTDNLEPGMVIDIFLRSLALDQHEMAVGIILSGSGSDGTLGARAIKSEGGVVIAQAPESGGYDGMPRNVIHAGLADYILPPSEMPALLASYASHLLGRGGGAAVDVAAKAEGVLKKVVILLGAHTGHDFSGYKPSTILRRLERRMAIHQIQELSEYVGLLQKGPAEVNALFRDCLIGVTSFYRDPYAYDVLERQLAEKIAATKAGDDPLRVWSAGCSTGEEAYSLAISLQEVNDAQGRTHPVQVFATDIDGSALASARIGSYPASISADIHADRLMKFFEPERETGTFKIRKIIREKVLFCEHSLIRDPPFSRLDVISCRNLMIYLGGELQKGVVPLFHYALKPGGLLLLGASESVGEYSDLFAVVDRKAKLFRRREAVRVGYRAFLEHFPGFKSLDVLAPKILPQSEVGAGLSLREQVEQALLRHVGVAGALVNERGDILYLHGRTGDYLEPAQGESGANNVVKMARQGFMWALNTGLRKVAATSEPVYCDGLSDKANGGTANVRLSILPMVSRGGGNSQAQLFLVIFETTALPERGAAGPPWHLGSAEAGTSKRDGSESVDAKMFKLRQEMQAREDFLRTVTDEQETLSEELKSSNEEMRSINEELQTSNEEMEISKEELQSLNQELATLNAELRNRIGELSRANSDMNNLLAGTGIGTIFVDLQMQILRFTPVIAKIINLIPTDIGRSVGHISSNLVGYDSLVSDVQSVLDQLVPKEVEVQSRVGKWYTLRILPYRTLENVVEGAVITFVDVTEVKLAMIALRESDELCQKLFFESPLGIALIDASTNRVVQFNQMFAELMGRRPEEIGQRDWLEFTQTDSQLGDLEELRLLQAGKRSRVQWERRVLSKEGNELWVRMTFLLLSGAEQRQRRLFCMLEGLAGKNQIEMASNKTLELLRLAMAARDAEDAVAVQGLDGRILAWNQGAVRMYGWTEAEALAMNAQERIPAVLWEESWFELERLSRAEILEPYSTQRMTKSGRVLAVTLTSTALLNDAREMYAIATTERQREKATISCEGAA